MQASDATEIFYEAPHRLAEALRDLVASLGPARPVVLARELTKIHEEFLRGSAAEVLESIQGRGAVKGEIVLLIGKAISGEQPAAPAGIRWKPVISAPDSVVGNAQTRPARAAAIAFAVSITRPPPSATSDGFVTCS